MGGHTHTYHSLLVSNKEHSYKLVFCVVEEVVLNMYPRLYIVMVMHVDEMLPHMPRDDPKLPKRARIFNKHLPVCTSHRLNGSRRSHKETWTLLDDVGGTHSPRKQSFKGGVLNFSSPALFVFLSKRFHKNSESPHHICCKKH